MPATVTLLSLNIDVLSEILARLSVEDLVKIRRVCRALLAAGRQHTVWYSQYKQSKLLLPDGPTFQQPTRELERLLIRSSQLHSTWGPNASRDQRITNKFTFPRALPAYSFDAQVISGRYLQLAEQDAISWYDLDGDCGKPLVTYKCPYIATIAGYLSYHTNAQGEGENSIWVTFICSYPMRIMVLKLWLGADPKVTLEASLSAESVIEVKLASDYVLPVKEFASRDEPLELYHIPSKTTFNLPRHSLVQTLADLGHVSYLFSPDHLLMLFPLKSETHIEVYPLPHTKETMPSSNSLLSLSHQGVYPHMISRSNLFNRRPSQKKLAAAPTEEDANPTECTKSTNVDSEETISLLSVVYMRQSPSPGAWTSKVNLHLLDARLRTSGAIEFSTRCSQMLQVGIAATTLSSTSHNGTGFAITHSSPGPTIRVYHIQDQDGSEPSMSAQTLKLPSGLQSREMLAFDGYRGRLCLVHGWTRIEVIDYA